MRNYLSDMLSALTSAYTRKDYDNCRRGSPPETNIGKLFAVLAWGLGIVGEQADLIKSWDNLDNACGEVLDRYGMNFGVERLGTTDDFYRLTIKVKVMSQLSGGSDDTVIYAASELFDVDPSEVELEDDFPAKKILTVNGRIIPEHRIKLVDQIGVALKRLVAAGVGLNMRIVYIFHHVVEVSYELENWCYTMPACNTLYCGTFPYPATLGQFVKAPIRSTPRIELTLYIPRFAGVYPIVKTLGWLTNNNILANKNVVSTEYSSKPAGEEWCGVDPYIVTIGWVQQNAVGSSAVLEALDYLAKLCGTAPDDANVTEIIEAEMRSNPRIAEVLSVPPFCDAENCGAYPDAATVFGAVRGYAELSGDIEIYKSISKRVGLVDCGTSPENVTLGKLSKADMNVSGGADGISVNSPYEKADCGTIPYSTGTVVQAQSETALKCSAEGYPVSVPLCNTKYCGQR